MPLPEDNKAFAKAMNPWPLDAVVKWIKDNMDPEDVFTDMQLDEWARCHGYKEDEDHE